MTASHEARDLILQRIRAAAPPADALKADSIARDYVRRGRLARKECVHLMAERLREYDAEVMECPEAGLAQAIESHLAASGKRIFAAPAALPRAWQARGVEWRLDENLDYAAIESVDGVVTAASAGIADSGTIVLHHGPLEGRRVLSLLPDWHLCILRTSQIVETLPEYFDRFSQQPRLATYISGPSATADIEMTRIKGVHGPRFLRVLLVDDAEGDAGNAGAARREGVV